MPRAYSYRVGYPKSNQFGGVQNDVVGVTDSVKFDRSQVVVDDAGLSDTAAGQLVSSPDITLLTQDFTDLSGLASAVDYHYEVTLDALGQQVGLYYVETQHDTGAVGYEEEEVWTFGGTCP